MSSSELFNDVVMAPIPVKKPCRQTLTPWSRQRTKSRALWNISTSENHRWSFSLLALTLDSQQAACNEGKHYPTPKSHTRNDAARVRSSNWVIVPTVLVCTRLFPIRRLAKKHSSLYHLQKHLKAIFTALVSHLFNYETSADACGLAANVCTVNESHLSHTCTGRKTKGGVKRRERRQIKCESDGLSLQLFPFKQNICDDTKWRSNETVYLDDFCVHSISFEIRVERNYVKPSAETAAKYYL